MTKLQVFRKYWRLWVSFFRASLISDLEFRANFFIRLATDIFWYLAQIIVFESLYRFTDRIGSWTLEQSRVFLGLLFVADGIYMVFLSENLDRMSEKVRKGELDLLLAKPVNSQFMLSLQRVGTAMLGNLVVGSGYLIWALHQYSDFSGLRLLWILVLIPSGILCLYSFRFMFSASATIFTKSENLQYVWYQVYRLGLRPDSIYAPWLRGIILSAIPVGMVASIPARAVLGEPEWGLYLWSIFLGFFFLKISQIFWKFCLKKYTSASS